MRFLLNFKFTGKSLPATASRGASLTRDRLPHVVHWLRLIPPRIHRYLIHRHHSAFNRAAKGPIFQFPVFPRVKRPYVNCYCFPLPFWLTGKMFESGKREKCLCHSPGLRSIGLCTSVSPMNAKDLGHLSYPQRVDYKEGSNMASMALDSPPATSAL